MKRKKFLSGLLLYGLGCLTGVIASYSFYKFHTIPIENGGSHNYSITDNQGIDVSNHQGLIDWEKVASDKKNTICIYQVGLAFTFGALALLFQPFFKIALGRTVWNVVDVVVAIGLLFLVVKSFNKNLDKK